MKNIDKLYELLENHNVYFSSNASEMKPYINHLKNFKGIVPIKNSLDEKILVFAYLTSNKKIETEIIVSNDFLVQDHRAPGAKNSFPCVTVFVRFQDIKFKEVMKELQAQISSF